MTPPYAPSNRRRRKRGRSGSALFEFAITLPLALLMAIAILDFAKISFLHFLVADAAGAASRYASTVPANMNALDLWQQNLQMAARESLSDSSWIDPQDLDVPPALIQEIDSDERRIAIRVEYSFNTVFDWLKIDQQTTITCEVIVYGAQ